MRTAYRPFTIGTALAVCLAGSGCNSEIALDPSARRVPSFADMSDVSPLGDTVIALGAPNGQRDSEARDVNNRGDIVGSAQVSPLLFHAVLWHIDGTVTDLGALGPNAQSFAWGVSSAGTVTGQSSTNTGERHAFSWTDGAGMVDLGTLPGGHESGAFRSSSSGLAIAGYSLTAQIEQHAVVWTPGGIQDLGVLSQEAPSAAALATNDAGVVVGVATPGPFRSQHAFRWTLLTGMVDLGTLVGDQSAAYAVNARGDVVGESTVAGGESHAVMWTADGQTIDLGTLPTGVRSFARDINDQGQVVGIATIAWSDGRQVERGFIWTRQAGMQELLPSDPTVVGVRNNAWAISNSGLVGGEAELYTGGTGAVLWPGNRF